MREQLPLGLDDVAPTPRRRQRLAFHAEHVHMTVEEAQAGEKKASAQDAAILRLMQHPANAGHRWTPTEVWWSMGGDPPTGWLKTSIRRALTNLTNRGLLIHYKADRREGPHGAKESTWGLA